MPFRKSFPSDLTHLHRLTVRLLITCYLFPNHRIPGYALRLDHENRLRGRLLASRRPALRFRVGNRKAKQPQ